MSLTILISLAVALGGEPVPPAVTPTEALALARMLVADNPGRASLTPIGASFSGISIDVLTISENILTHAQKPAVLLVAGLDGLRPSSVAVSVRVAQELLTNHELLRSTTFYIVPCANPDAYSRVGALCTVDASRNLRPIDEDRDGRVNEDHPQDINGDGAITMMRRLAPPAEDPPTHLPDPADPRLMRTPDATKDLRATHTLWIEGLDSDQDGLIAEDAIGGVEIDRNFPHRWEEFDRAVGATQLSEPESQSIAAFVLDHPRIIAGVVIGRWESLARTPDAQPRDITGKTPLALDGGDRAVWEALGTRWKELAGQARFQECDPSGSLALWLYAHRGIPTFATQLWGRPDPSPAPQPPGEVATTAPAPPLTAANTDDAAWLQWSDRDQGHRGFIEWTPFQHPTLGPVEIGGFRSQFRSDPPPSELPRLATALTTLCSELASKQPRVALRNVSARAIAPGVLELQCEVVNEGWLPTASAMGRINKQQPPILVRLSTPKDHLLSGQRVTLIEGLGGAGDRKHFRWIVRTPAREQTTLEVVWIPAGTQRITVSPDASLSMITVTP